MHAIHLRERETRCASLSRPAAVGWAIAVVVSLVLAMAFLGCGTDDSNALLGAGTSAPAGPDLAPGVGGLIPGAFYSACENPVDLWFTELMHIGASGTGTVIAHLDMVPDPVYGGAPTVFGLAFDLDGALYTAVTWPDFVPGHEKTQLARVDPLTGALTYIGPEHANTFTGTDIDADGNLWASGFQTGCPEDPTTPVIFGDGQLYRIDKYTGAATAIGPTGVPDLMDLAFDSKGTLWGTVANRLYTLDLTTGAASFALNITGVVGQDVAGIPPEDWEYMEVMSIAFDDQDVLWAAAMKGCSWVPGNSPVMRIDTATGAATIVGYTNQPYCHGGDFVPRFVRVAHLKGNGAYSCITINLRDLPAHLAHGDYVPGVGGHSSQCP